MWQNEKTAEVVSCYRGWLRKPQNNSCDCGLFAIENLMRASHDLHAHIAQAAPMSREAWNSLRDELEAKVREQK